MRRRYVVEHGGSNSPSEKLLWPLSPGPACPHPVDFCERTEGFEDVLSICSGWIPPEVQEPTAGLPGKLVVLGYVYLLRSGKHYKMGHTNAVGRRERELAIQLPERARIVHKIETDDPSGIEAYWHRRFEAKRGNGEWFALSAEDVARFRQRKKM